MGGKREYTAIFSIGARLLGSFRGAMAAAQSRLARLQAATMRVGGAMRRMARGLSILGTIFSGFAAFGISKIFSRIFEDANREISEAHDRTRKLTAALMKNQNIVKKGPAYLQQQNDLLMAHNQALAQQGLLAGDTLDSMTAQIALSGAAPAEIAKAMGPMADVLVAIKGVHASEEQGIAFAKAWGKALKGGPVKALQQFGINVSPQMAKAFKTMKIADINKELLKLAKFAKGKNVEALADPEGKMVKLNEDISEMSERIGAQLLPAQGRMADAWRRILPRIEPILTKAIKGVMKLFEMLADYIETTVIPAFERLNAFWEAHPELQQGIIDIAANIGKATAVFAVFALAVAVNPMVWVTLAAAAVLVLANNWDAAARSASEYVRQQEALGKTDSPLFVMVKLVDDLTTGFDLMGVAIDTYVVEPINRARTALNDFTNEWKKIPVAGWFAPKRVKMMEHVAPPGARQRLLDKTKPVVLPPKPPAEAMLPATVDVYRTAAKNIVVPVQAMQKTTEDYADVTQTSTPKVKNFVQEVSDLSKAVPQATTELGYLIAALRFMSDMTAPSIISTPAAMRASRQYVPPDTAVSTGALPAPDIPADTTGATPYATGGIVTKPTLATLAEKGPEAVVPLARAAATIGETKVSFAPNITIHGNASEAEQRALDERLRSLAREFVDNFTRAQRHERRLSYEGGYG